MNLLENPILQLSMYILIPVIVTIFLKIFWKSISIITFILSTIAVGTYFLWVTGYDALIITQAQDNAHESHCGNTIMGMYIAHIIVGLTAAIITQIVLSFILVKKAKT